MEFQNSDQYYGKVQKSQQPQVEQQQAQRTYEQQLYDKWYSILTNRELIPGKIQPPEDDVERAMADKAAEDIKNDKTLQSDLHARAIGYLRKSKAYIRKRTTQNTKDSLKFQKEGVGSYDQMDVQPKSTNVKDIFEAAERAGKQAALYYKQGRQEDLVAFTNTIKNTLGNKAYNVVFYYTYLTNIKYTEATKEQDRVNRINSLKLQYDNYKQKANNNQFETGALDRIRGYNQNTTQQVYNAK